MAISITRSKGETERSRALAQRLARLGAPCVGCKNCRGMCRELIELMTLPELILKDTRESA
ncbi:hypothetical protein FLO80_10165 [Aquicoccus porphyridii]|uniref:Uncharacterized protein n=1 Tax=Aquicoccus porphyridii TaxID=1852029 RepID=A0A5A9ZGH7_9RHOB|nr:hypothetical protein [Aquicoccus porphyridii]KAA0916085.1 hypothetical protein FLO80_10165 [Aquicoccus porphyridii]RAI52724.1 hypothetical protein DOO74_16375 [Rhodobacteraceae bacterium AsT-22]